MTLILGVNIPGGVTIFPISSPSPKFAVYQEIWRAQYPQYLDGGHKVWISQPKLSFFFNFFFNTYFASHSSYGFNGSHFLFYSPSFLAKTSAGFPRNDHVRPPSNKKRMTPLESFGCTLGELQIFFQLKIRKFTLGKSWQIQRDPLGRTSS